jgi:hypothetical protein
VEIMRELTLNERQLLEKLLEPDFPGRDELRSQVANSKVRTLHEDGTLEFVEVGGPTASVVQRVPVEATYDDRDGIAILVLLHVMEGKLNELEIVKFGDSPIVWPPTPDRLHPKPNLQP